MDGQEILDFLLDNLKKFIFPEEWLDIDRNMSKQELFALLIVDRNGEMIMSQIAEYINAPMSTATGIVDRLVKKGFLNRDRDDHDRRIVVIRISEQGRTMMNHVKTIVMNYVTRIQAHLTAEEIQFLFRIITKIMGVLTQENTEKSENGNSIPIQKITID